MREGTPLTRVVVALLVIVLLGCTPTPTAVPAVTPVAPATPLPQPSDGDLDSNLIPSDELEAELGRVGLDFVLREHLNAPAELQRSVEQAGEVIPDDATIIVWAPAKRPPDESAFSPLNLEAPTKVWWQWDDRLVEARDPVAVLQRLREQPTATPSERRLYIEYGASAVSTDGDLVAIYVGLYCGPLCGQGSTITFERDDAGQWIEKERAFEWIS